MMQKQANSVSGSQPPFNNESNVSCSYIVSKLDENLPEHFCMVKHAIKTNRCWKT